MYTTDTYNRILGVIEQEISLPADWLLCSKTEDATDARCFLCHYLNEAGLSSAQIQKLTGLKKSTVNKHIADFEHRARRRSITWNWRLQIDHILQPHTFTD